MAKTAKPAARKKKAPDLNSLNFETLLLDFKAGIATVTLNRPKALNAMSVTMREELGECFEQLRYDPRVRAVIITGAGKDFCVGGDVNDFNGTDHEDLHDLIRLKSHRWFSAVWNLPQPTIAAVNGTAAGGGCNLALACDYVIAAPEARIGETFVRVGLVPDLGGLFILPRIIGMQRAKQLCFSGKVLNADEALAMGLFTEVVPAPELMGRAKAIAVPLSKAPAKTMAAMKAVLNKSFEYSMDDMLQLELYVQSFMFATGDHREALDAFLHRRPPKFK
jgi:2-(1,2-epoxy-1,2-dihydrophenyl)acetyl-CoA isomerase